MNEHNGAFSKFCILLNEQSSELARHSVTITCNICGSAQWSDMNGRIAVKCQSCGSLERTRAIKLIIDKLRIPSATSKILHLAPETGLLNYLSSVSPAGYEAVDYSPENFPSKKVRRFNIITDCSTLVENNYDLIIHSHVAEHIPCALAYMFFHLSRSLKRDGYHIFCLPLMAGHYEEDFGPLTEEEAFRRFGQGDHVRRFGIDDLDRHLGLIMRLEPHYSLSKYASEAEMDSCNIPPSERSGFNGSTIFVARKTDYLLQ